MLKTLQVAHVDIMWTDWKRLNINTLKYIFSKILSHQYLALLSYSLCFERNGLWIKLWTLEQTATCRKQRVGGQRNMKRRKDKATSKHHVSCTETLMVKRGEADSRSQSWWGKERQVSRGGNTLRQPGGQVRYDTVSQSLTPKNNNTNNKKNNSRQWRFIWLSL